APAPPAALVAPGRAALGASARAARPPSGLSGTRPAPARVGSDVRARPLTADGRPLAAVPALPATGGAPAAALPRTGLTSHIPLAGAGGLLAIGGAAIVLGEPRRRTAAGRRRRRPAPPTCRSRCCRGRSRCPATRPGRRRCGSRPAGGP